MNESIENKCRAIGKSALFFAFVGVMVVQFTVFDFTVFAKDGDELGSRNLEGYEFDEAEADGEGYIIFDDEGVPLGRWVQDDSGDWVLIPKVETGIIEGVINDEENTGNPDAEEENSEDLEPEDIEENSEDEDLEAVGTEGTDAEVGEVSDEQQPSEEVSNVEDSDLDEQYINPDIPQTGDSMITMLITFSMGMVIALCGIVFLMRRKNRGL